MSYDRYKRFRGNGQVSIPPFVKIMPKSTDYFEEYKKGMTRLDVISNEYYGNPDYDWLILMANPEAGGMEFMIPDGYVLRIPFPLDATLENYNKEIDRISTLYGIN